MTEAEQIRQFVKELQGKYFKRFGEKDLGRIKNQPNAQSLYAFQDNEIVGVVLLSWFRSLTRNVLTIEDLIILPKFRGKGYGKQLVKWAIQFAKNRGVDCVEVMTKSDNSIAKKLYEEGGFKDRKQTAYRLWLK